MNLGGLLPRKILMLILLSPAKTQNFSSDYSSPDFTVPQLAKKTAALISILKTYSVTALKKQLAVSDKLAELNYQRFKAFNPNQYTLTNAKPAIYVFAGDAYRGLAAPTLTSDSINYLQQHLLILSGLYGCLRPLDLMQAYRLEMKTPLCIGKHQNLYSFWQETLTETITTTVKKNNSQVIINLASTEYASAVMPKKLAVPFITVDFKEKYQDSYRTVGVHAKRARGLMVRFIAENQLTSQHDLKSFTNAGYRFAEKLSTDNNLSFIR